MPLENPFRANARLARTPLRQKNAAPREEEDCLPTVVAVKPDWDAATAGAKMSMRRSPPTDARSSRHAAAAVAPPAGQPVARAHATSTSAVYGRDTIPLGRGCIPRTPIAPRPAAVADSAESPQQQEQKPAAAMQEAYRGVAARELEVTSPLTQPAQPAQLTQPAQLAPAAPSAVPVEPQVGPARDIMSLEQEVRAAYNISMPAAHNISPPHNSLR